MYFSNVFLTYFDYFFGGQYKLGGLRGTRWGVKPPDKSSTDNKALLTSVLTNGPQNIECCSAKKWSHIGNGGTLKSMGKFCYLGDMLNANARGYSVVVLRLRCAW